MTKTILTIVVIAVIILGFRVYNTSKKKEVVNVSVTPITTTTPGAITIPTFTIANGVYTVEPKDIKVTWTGRKVVLKNWIDSGTVAVKSASFEVKNNAVATNSLVMDMTTITNATNGSGKNQDMLTKHLKSADFFDVAQFPTAVFVAKAITQGSTTKDFIVTGNMTIKGMTNEIAILVTMSVDTNKVVTAHGSVDLDRTDWNIKYGSTKFFEGLGDKVIDDMFNISFDAKFTVK